MDTIVISDQTEFYHVEIIVVSENEPCWMKLTGRQILNVMSDGNYENAKILSADLVAHVGHKDAVDLLKRNGIPETSDLWDLNHRKRKKAA